MQPKRVLVIIALVTIIAAIIDLPKELPININSGALHINTVIYRPEIDFTILGKRIYKPLEIKKGLDLQGGTQIILRADMDDINEQDKKDALESSKEIINRRIDLFGVSEPLVQTSVVENEYRILAELPGIENIDEALDLIGTTAQLSFKELDPSAASESADLNNFIETGLTGKNLSRSRVEFDPNTSQPVVTLEFNDEGANLFEEITGRNIGKPVAIFLDDIPVTIPIVQAPITGGSAVISGQFTTEVANSLSIQLNAGALPVPIEIIEQRNIGATLGNESVEKSIRAGIVGLSSVMIFMIIYYGRLGVLADIALIIYGLITLAVYKIIPVTVSLPGLAGFILSVGMAVDSNILIFERMKEELRSGKKREVAMELGFGRAWDSIKDANIATLITAFILFNPLNWNFLNRSGMIRGFALTLSIGILVSLFTGIIVTRTLMRIFYKVENKND